MASKKKELLNFCSSQVKDGFISEDSLKKLGFDSGDISRLVNERLIEEFEPGRYILIQKLEDLQAEVLLKRGKLLFEEYKSDQAKKYYDYCLEIDSTHRPTYLHILFNVIKARKYESAFKCIDRLYEISNEQEKREVNLYLYMLGLITKVPDRYMEKIERFTANDLTLGYFECYKDQTITNYLFCGKIRYAKDNMSDKKPGDISKDKIIKILMRRYNEFEEEMKKTIVQHIENETFPDLIELLESIVKSPSINKRINFFMSSSLILVLVKAIDEIKTTRIVPIPEVIETSSLVLAIKWGNFALAKKLNEECAQKIQVPLTDPISILLIKINELIGSLGCSNPLEDEIDEPNLGQEAADSGYSLKKLQQILYDSIVLEVPARVVATNYNLSHEEIQLICLIQVRDYYIDEDYAAGDKLLEKVVNSGDITDGVNRFIQKLKQDKCIYKKRAYIHTLKCKISK